MKGGELAIPPQLQYAQDRERADRRAAGGAQYPAYSALPGLQEIPSGYLACASEQMLPAYESGRQHQERSALVRPVLPASDNTGSLLRLKRLARGNVLRDHDSDTYRSL